MHLNNRISTSFAQTVLLWSLALVMILFSCPIKKVFYSHNTATATAPSKAGNVFNQSGSVASQKGTSCCIQKTETKWNVSQQKTTIPVVLYADNLLHAAGFGIFYATSLHDRNHINVVDKIHSLPLYLQNRVLLI